MTAGTTFLGQFLDHDMTFDTTSPLGVPTDPEASPNARTPALDLDSVYGGGPTASPQLYDRPTGSSCASRSGGLFEDLPRSANGHGHHRRPAQRRERHHLRPAGRVDPLRTTALVDWSCTQPGRADDASVFTQARRTAHLALPVDHRQRVPAADHRAGDGHRHPHRSGRRCYRPEPGPAFIPVEFQGAAYRFGHSMVRPSYRANLAGNADGTPFFGYHLRPGRRGPGRPGRPARRRAGAGAGSSAGRRSSTSAAIRPSTCGRTSASTPRSPRRCSTCRWAPSPAATRRPRCRSATCCATSPGRSRPASASPQAIGHRCCTGRRLAHYGVALENQTPLWYYVMAEAELLNNGLRLGPDRRSHRRRGLHRPAAARRSSVPAVPPAGVRPCPAQSAGTFKMTDLLR